MSFGGFSFGNSGSTGGGLFGSQQPQQQPSTSTSGGLFGQNTQSQQPQTSAAGGLFGSTNTQNQPSTGGGLFGNSQSGTQQPSTGGGLFGNTQSNTPSTGGGLFGNTQSNTQQPSTGGGLFGNTQSNTQQPSTGGGLFGSTSQNQQPSTGGGLFGSTSLNQQNQPSTGGLFGAKPATGTGGGLFGSTTQQPSTGSGLFGNTTQNQQQPQQSGGLFGSTTQNQQQQPSGGGLFGNTTQNQQQPQQSGGLFGSTTQNQQQQQQPSGGGLFGGSTLLNKSAQPSTGGGLFGSTQPQQPSTGGGLLGSTQQSQPLGGGLFGSQQPPQQSSILGNQVPLSQSVGKPPQNANKDIGVLIEDLKNAWDPNHPQCKFQFYFYNSVPPEQVQQYGRPPIVKNDISWAKAVQENPDPTRLVPAPAFGFDDLQKRVNAQSKQATAHLVRLSELQEKLRKMALSTTISHSPRLQRAALMHAQLAARLLKLIKHLHLLLPTLRASSIRSEEEKLKADLESTNEIVKKARIGGRVNEAWALVGALKSRKEEGKSLGAETGWTIVDDDGMKELQHILSEQQAGLAHLTKTLQNVENDLNVVRSGFGLSQLTIQSNE